MMKTIWKRRECALLKIGLSLDTLHPLVLLPLAYDRARHALLLLSPGFVCLRAGLDLH